MLSEQIVEYGDVKRLRELAATGDSAGPDELRLQWSKARQMQPQHRSGVDWIERFELRAREGQINYLDLIAPTILASFDDDPQLGAPRNARSQSRLRNANGEWLLASASGA